MQRRITVTDEGLEELHELLEHELSETRTEYRRTRNPDYRDKVKHHIDVTRGLLSAVEHSQQL